MLIMLALDAKEFIEICNRHPVAKEILLERAYKRREMFENYKTIILVKFMKCIQKDPSVLEWSKTGENNGATVAGERLQTGDGPQRSQGYELKMSLIDCFIEHMNLNRWMRKRIGMNNQASLIYNNYNSSLGNSKCKDIFS